MRAILSGKWTGGGSQVGTGGCQRTGGEKMRQGGGEGRTSEWTAGRESTGK